MISTKSFIRYGSKKKIINSSFFEKKQKLVFIKTRIICGREILIIKPKDINERFEVSGIIVVNLTNWQIYRQIYYFV